MGDANDIVTVDLTNISHIIARPFHRSIQYAWLISDKLETVFREDQRSNVNKILGRTLTERAALNEAYHIFLDRYRRDRIQTNSDGMFGSSPDAQHSFG